MKIVLFIVGMVVCGLGLNQCQLATKADETPQTLTCEQLGTDGPGDNIHVVMTEFLLLEQAYAYTEGHFGKWEAAWVPAVKLGGEYHQLLDLHYEENGDDAEPPPPESIHVLVKLSDVHSEEAVTRVGARDELRGIVINGVELMGAGLGLGERRILENSYPGIDFKRCRILDVGLKPKNFGMVVFLITAGLVLIVGVAIAWWVGQRRTSAASATLPQWNDDEPDDFVVL